MTPALANAVLRYIQTVYTLESPRSSDRGREVVLIGEDNPLYQDESQHLLPLDTKSAHGKMVALTAQTNLKSSWETWKTSLGKSIPTLSTPYSRPALRFYFDVYDIDMILLGDVTLTFGDTQFNWRRHPDSYKISSLPSQNIIQMTRAVDQALNALATLPKSTGIYGFGTLAQTKGYSTESTFETAPGSSPETAALTLAYMRNPFRHLSMAKDMAKELLQKDIVQVIPSKTALKNLKALTL